MGNSCQIRMGFCSRKKDETVTNSVTACDAWVSNSLHAEVKVIYLCVCERGGRGGGGCSFWSLCYSIVVDVA